MLGNLPKHTQARQNIVNNEPDEQEETKEQAKEGMRQFLGLTNWGRTFATFKVVNGTKRAFDAMKAMAVGKHKPMFLLCGGIGNGKTHLCESLSIELYKQGIKCPITLWAELRRQLLQAMHRPKPRQVDYDTLFDNFRKRKYVIIDDVGMGSKMTEWEESELEDIINYRYREGLFTVMTTNRALEELPERVVSRFFDPEVSEVVVNEGKDYRLNRAGGTNELPDKNTQDIKDM